MRYTFTHHERLKREQHIKTLFRTGKAFSSFPLKCIWLPLPRDTEPAPARIAISIPKKRVPHATKRNRIKRLIRECWRLNKHQLYSVIPGALQLHLFFIFNGQQEPDYKTVEQAMAGLINTLIRQQTSGSHA